jgi:hypothetical protein
MRRTAAIVLLIWGVATIVIGVANAAIGAIPSEKLPGAAFAGGLLIAIALWLEYPRKPRVPR